MQNRGGIRDHVALVLAVTVGLVLLVFAGASAYALDHNDLTVSAETVAFLTTSTGGIVGILGAYLGYKAANGHADGGGDAPE